MAECSSLKSVTDLAGIETAMSDADIDVYAMFLRGTYTTADGNEITTSFAVEVEDASGLLTDNSMTVDDDGESVPSVAACMRSSRMLVMRLQVVL